mmetsp:Transcript_64310/g.191649  ORF Transcript_64310/g.191649 Transcript_64310/m.191649 type:complete len:223 (-) Transcript_64310:1493-2161(-)
MQRTLGQEPSWSDGAACSSTTRLVHTASALGFAIPGPTHACTTATRCSCTAVLTRRGSRWARRRHPRYGAPSRSRAGATITTAPLRGTGSFAPPRMLIQRTLSCGMPVGVAGWASSSTARSAATGQRGSHVRSRRRRGTSADGRRWRWWTQGAAGSRSRAAGPASTAQTTTTGSSVIDRTSTTGRCSGFTRTRAWAARSSRPRRGPRRPSLSSAAPASRRRR